MAAKTSKRKRIEIEPTFNEFVADFGGERVSTLVGKTPNFLNADYLFRKEGIIAELKCLEKDFIADLGYQKKLDRLYDEWCANGLIAPFPRRRINTRDLPDRCQRDVIKIFKDPLRRILTKANKQIRETKKRLDMPDAKGLLLLANDGNYTLESETILNLVTQLTSTLFSSLNYTVYFTVNVPSQLQTIDNDIYLWSMAHHKSEGTKPSYEFLDKLGDAWIKFVSEKIEISHQSKDAPKQLLEHLIYKSPRL